MGRLCAVSDKRYEIDMCAGPIAPKLLTFALPLMASGILQLLFNAADVVVVGQFAGDAALAAVTSTTSLINLLVNLFIGLSIGTNVTVAHALGSGDRRRAGRAVHTSILISVISGVVLGLFGIAAAPTLLRLMSSPANVIHLSALYLRIYFLGMPAVMAYNFGSAILRAGGDTRRPLNFLLVAGVLNVALNLVFVILFDMGVAGVGAATAISQYLSAFLVIRCLMAERGELRLDLKQLRADPVVLRQIVRTGLPAGFQGVVFSLSNVVIQSTINGFGDVVMAGSGAASSIEGFIYAGMNAFYQACLTFTSQNYGAGNTHRVDRVLLWCQGMVLVVGLMLGNLVCQLGPQLLGIYSASPEVVQAGLVRLRMIAIPYFLCGMMEVMVGVMRGLGWSVVPMIVSLVGACGLRLAWIALIFPLRPTPECLYFSYVVSWTITGLVHVICFLTIRPKAYARVAPGADPELPAG